MAKKRNAEKKVERVDFLMWVGSVYYPTVDDYIAEAESRGPCKRLGRIPQALLESLKDENITARIFLAHDDGLVGDGFVFGYFEPTAIEYVAKTEDNIPYDLVDLVEWVDANVEEDPRDCGDRGEGSYVVRISSHDQFEAGFVIFDKPRILESFDPGRSHFRGMLRIDYGSKLAGKVFKRHTIIPPSRLATEVEVDAEWTDEEDEMILDRVANSESLSRAAQEIAYELGRTKNAVIYRFRKITKNEEE